MTHPRPAPRFRPAVEPLEARDTPASLVTIVPGAAGTGTLDVFLGGADGTLAAGDGGAVPGTLSAGALASVTATTDISVTATGSVAFSDLGGPLSLLTAAGHTATFTAGSAGSITFANPANTLSTAGGALLLTAPVNLTPGQLATAGGNVTLTGDVLDVQQPVNAGTGVVTLQPFTATAAVTVGGGAGAFGVSDAELGRLTAGAVRIGNTTMTGTITIDGAVTRHAGYTTLRLLTGNGTAAAVAQTAPLSVANLAVQTATGGVVLTNAANDADTVAAFVGLAFQFTDANAVTVGAADGVTGAQATGNIQLTAAGGVTVTTAVIAGAAGVVTVNADLTLVGAGIGGGTLVLGGNVATQPAATASLLGTTVLDLNGATRTFDVADGAAATDLAVSGAIQGGAVGVTKTGAGLLVFMGAAANTYTGPTTVTGGVLGLFKTDGVVSVAGPLVVGDATGPDIVRAFAASQVADAATVTVNPGGVFDLNGEVDTVAALAVVGGGVTMGGASVLTLAGDLTLTGGSVQGGRIVLGGTVVSLAAATGATVSARLDLAGATRTITVADGAAVTDLTLSGVIAGAGVGLTKAGAGALRLTGANTYTGATTAAAGTLQIDGVQPGSAVAVAGGTLAGSGTVGPVTGTAGTFAPGRGITPRMLTTGPITLGPTTFAVLLSDAFAGTSDQLNVGGAVDLTGSTLALTRTGAAAGAGFRFLLVANDGTDPVVGTFAGLPEGSTVVVDGQAFTLSYAGGDGNDVILTAAAPPTPPGAGPRPLAVSGLPDGSAVAFVPTPGGGYSSDGTATLRPFGVIPADVRVAVADVNGDTVPDVILVTGPGVPARFAVVSGTDFTTLLVSPTDVFEGFTGGAFVAAGDFDGDGRAEFVITPDRGGGPRVSIFSLMPTGLVTRANYFTVDANFRGGARAAVGDVNRDGTPDLAVAAGFGGGPRVALINGTKAIGTDGFNPADRLVGDFFAFPDALRNGVYVAIGDVDGDGFGDLIFGAGPGGGPQVLTISGQKLLADGSVAAVAAPLSSFFVANTDSDRGGVRVAVTNTDGDNRADVAAATGEGRPGRVRTYLGRDFGGGEPTRFQDLTPFGGVVLTDGVFVG